IAVKYAWSDLHNIPSEQFAAYWVGQIEIKEGGNRTIGINEGRAQSRIFVDGKQVFPDENERNQGEITHYFSSGTHLIEVEYINNWHTTEYKVTIGEEREPPLDDEELRSRLGQIGSADIVYVSLYESGNQDTSVKVAVPRFEEPIVVWLDSYEGIDWTVDAPGGVSAFVIGSYAPATRILNNEDVPVYHSRSRIGIRDRGSSGGCSCSSGYFHCEQKTGIESLEQVLREKTGKELVGFGSAYSTARLKVARYEEADRARAAENARNIEAARRACEAEANPDFDTMLNDAPSPRPVDDTGDWGTDTPR
ncbi:MAG: hypothetical protein AAGK17_10970, partial [Pseudomonadota bacterium]